MDLSSTEKWDVVERYSNKSTGFFEELTKQVRIIPLMHIEIIALKDNNKVKIKLR